MLRLLLIALMALAVLPAHADEAGWAALKRPGTHAIMRHARAPGTGDPDGFRLDDCRTQRNLDARGRSEAAQIGAAIRSAGISVGVVLTSAWCRAKDTADLMALGPVTVEPALNSFFEERSEGPSQTAALMEVLRAAGGEKLLMVSHQVNITALTGVYPASGEIVVFSLNDAGRVRVEGRIRPS